ncbi:MAG TPA: RDD family protein [Chloroflexota bacterium]|nr:RDD family protein [Chloroflexota bacterium]
MFCENCGQRVDEGAKFCPACGARVAQPTSDIAPTESTHSPEQSDQESQPVEQASASNGTVDTIEADSASLVGSQDDVQDAGSTPPAPTGERPAATGSIPASSSASRRQPPAWAVTQPVAPARIRQRAEAVREETILPAVHLVGEPVLAQPGATVEVEEVARPIPKTVGFFRTLLAFVYDIAALAIGLIVVLSLGIESPNPAPFFILAIGLLVLYFPVGFANGRTVGHWATYTEITRADGGAKPGPVRGIIRTVTMFFSAAFLFLGFLWVMQDKQGQTWHDKVAGTLVVDSRRVTPDAAAT